LNKLKIKCRKCFGGIWTFLGDLALNSPIFAPMGYTVINIAKTVVTYHILPKIL